MSDLVQLHDHAGVVVVQLNRPEKLNAISLALEHELLDVVRSARVTESAAVVFTGSPRVFSAGADTSELPDMTPERIAAYYRGSGGLYDAVTHLPQPSVAAVAGYCLGAGFELALACDLRVADASAVFGLPEVSLGILPSSGGLTRLVRAVGPAGAREIILLGDRVSASDAYRRGLLLEVVPEGTALDAGLRVAERLAVQPKLAMAWTKAAIDAAAESSAATSLLIEQLAYAALNPTDRGAPWQTPSQIDHVRPR